MSLKSRNVYSHKKKRVQIHKQTLRRSLYHIFSQYGSIMDVVALKTSRLRGQAWIVFEDIGSATRAMRGLQSFPFYDKPMRIAFAKTKSRAVAIEDGTYKHKKMKKSKEKVYIGPPPTTSNSSDNKQTTNTKKSVASKVQEEQHSPKEHHTYFLCVRIFPRDVRNPCWICCSDNLGLVEVRFIEGNMAFVEYESVGQSTVVMGALQISASRTPRKIWNYHTRSEGVVYYNNKHKLTFPIKPPNQVEFSLPQGLHPLEFHRHVHTPHALERIYLASSTATEIMAIANQFVLSSPLKFFQRQIRGIFVSA